MEEKIVKQCQCWVLNTSSSVLIGIHQGEREGEREGGGGGGGGGGGEREGVSQHNRLMHPCP